MNPTLLLVDDEPQVLDSLRRVFRQQRYTLLTAGSGEEALGILREQHVDVLVADQRMPGITGVQLLQQARRIDPSISRILLSAYVDTEAILAASDEGEVQRFLHKPCEGRELRAVVREFIQDREVHERKEYFESLIASCPDAIFVTDLEGRVCFVSQHAVASLGEARSAILGRHVSSWLPGGKAEFADLAERLTRLGRLDEVEIQMCAPRGVIPVRFSVAPWMGAGGRVQGYIGTAKDISERKREEEELVRMNLELSAIKVIADAVMGSLELDPLLSRALEAILKVTDAPMGMIFLRDEAEGRLHRRVYQGLSEGFVSAVPVAPDLIERLVDEERGVVVIEDVRRLQDDFARMRSEEGMRTTVYIPLLRKERLTGLIANAYREVREIDSARRRFLLAIGGIVGTAVENASLFERTQAQAQRLDAAHREAQRRAEEIAALHHYSHSLSYTTDLPGLLDRTAEAFVGAMRAQAAGVLLRSLNQPEYAVYVPEGFGDAQQDALRGEFTAIVRKRIEDLAGFTADAATRPSGVSGVPSESAGNDLVVLLPGERKPAGLLWARRMVAEPFSAHEEQLALTLANQTASTLTRILHAMATERRKIEALVEGMIEPVIMLDEDFALVSMNAAARRLFDLGPQAPFDSFRLAPRALARAFERAAASPDEALHEEISFDHPSPRVHDVHLSPVFDSAGKRIGTVALFQDITSRREVEQMKAEFVANVSHELRTPLTSIKESISLLLDGVAGEVTESQSDCLRVALDESNRLVRLINDVLEISRIEAARLHLDRSLVSIRALAEETLKSLRVRAEQAGIRLDLEAPPRLPRIYVDPDRVTQILLNLLDNALKFTPRGGSITVHLENDPRGLTVRVIDTGRGIPPSELDRVFEKFHQVRSPHIRGTSGTGLGLSIVKALVEMHGGTITAESAPGQGSEFTFTLPKVDETASMRAYIESRISQARREEKGVGVLRLILAPTSDSGGLSVLRRQVLDHIRHRVYKAGDRIFLRGNATFVIVLEETDPSGAHAVRHRLDQWLRGELGHRLEGWSLQWASVVYPEDGLTASELLRKVGALDDPPEAAGEPPNAPTDAGSSGIIP